jgi:hypothetical protein
VWEGFRLEFIMERRSGWRSMERRRGWRSMVSGGEKEVEVE